MFCVRWVLKHSCWLPFTHTHIDVLGFLFTAKSLMSYKMWWLLLKPPEATDSMRTLPSNPPPKQVFFTKWYHKNHCFLHIWNSAGKWEHKTVALLLVLPHYYKPNRIICQYMTHSLLKLEAVNTSYVSDCVFKLFPCYHWLHWGSWTAFLCGIFTDTACAFCSVTLQHQVSLFCSST